MIERADRSIAAWLALCLFGIYLLSYSGLLYSQDSILMLSVTESAVKRGEFSADQMWTIYKARNELGADGEAYSKTGYGASLFAAPLYALALNLPGIGLMQTALLTSSIAIAMAAALLFLSARRLHFARGVSVGAALLLGLATPAFVYAKQFWSEPYALVTLFAAFYFLQCYRAETRARDALFAGIALGLAVAVRLTNVALVPVYAWYAFAPSRPFALSRLSQSFALSRLSRPFPFFAPLALFALSIAAYNAARYGNPLSSGYRADETFDNPILLGAYGLLFSPGKGLFVYAPFLAALVVALPLFFRRARRETIFCFLLFAFYLTLFSAWYYWWGGTNWGPRFLVPTLPFLVLLTAPAIELAFARQNRAFTILFFVLCILSFAIELIGVTVPSLAYRARLARLTPQPDSAAIFLPEFSPLVGSLNLLRPNVLDFAWVRVQAGVVSVDWIVIALTVGFIALCSMALQARLASPQPSLRFELPLAMTCAIALAFFSLARYSDDPRWDIGDGYRALAQQIAQDAREGDTLILNDDARMLYFLNANRARMRWYGLSRDPAQWDDATRALLARVARESLRIWFAYDDARPAPDPAREWADTFPALAEFDFEDGVHLRLFAPPR